MGERILITGLGVVSPVGNSVRSYWESLLSSGRSLPSPHPSLRPRHMSNRLAYQSPLDLHEPAGDSAAGLTSRFALEAAGQCLRDAGIEPEGWKNIGVSIGTAMGDTDRLAAARERKQPLETECLFPYGVSSTIAASFRLLGPNLTVCTACSASLYSVSLGVDAIRRGVTDAFLVGGAESFSRIALGCFNRLGALDGTCCRPFDSHRGGTVFGDGAAMMLLESEASVRSRGASHVYAAITGFGWSCDGYHPTAPDPEGREAESAVRRALEDADLAPAEIGCIVPHATGTELNDVVERDVLARVFDRRLEDMPVFAVKSKVGHGGGAAGAFSCLTAALIVDSGAVPPTANVTEIDPSCQVRLLTRSASTPDVKNVLVNAYAFGGNNVSMILGKTSD